MVDGTRMFKVQGLSDHAVHVVELTTRGSLGLTK